MMIILAILNAVIARILFSGVLHTKKTVSPLATAFGLALVAVLVIDVVICVFPS